MNIYMRLKNTTGPFRPTPVEPDDKCSHVDTVCSECLPEWEHDYDLEPSDDLDEVRAGNRIR